MSAKFRNLIIVFITLLSLFPLMTGILLTEVLSVENSIILIIISAIIFILGLAVAVYIDYNFSVYMCRKCGHIFKPTFSAYLWGMHTFSLRYLKCPECEEMSWCKTNDKLTKENI